MFPRMPSFALMKRAGVDAEHTAGAGREGWTSIKCASKRAYGCGKGGSSAVQDLDLLLHHGDLESLSSSFSVRAGDKVFRWIDKVIAEKRRSPGNRYFRSKVEIVDKGLIVVTLSFAEYGGLDYYLLFDAVDRSLSLTPYMPDWATYSTTCPLPLRRDDGTYSLVLFGTELGRVGEHDFFWQWSPSRPDVWQAKELRFPTEIEEDHFFYPDVIFSFDGMAFWTDLALGTLCCDRRDLLAPGGPPVYFTFIELPPGYQVDRDGEDTWSVELYRTMGCAGGSVKFVSIEKPADPYGCRGARVKVWTLEPSGGEWKLYSDIRLKNLWKDYLKPTGLPKVLPTWPMLREHEEGATLYFILADEKKTKARGYEVEKYYLCRLDMITKSLVEYKLLAHTVFVQEPVILPSGFFEYLDPLPSPILMEGG